MKLGFDLDEVVANLTDILLKYIKEEFDLDWTIDNFVKYDLLKNRYHDDDDASNKIATRAIEVVSDIDIQSTAKPYEEAPSFLRRLRKEGHSIHFITARKRGEENKTAKWLRKYKIPFESVNHVGYGEEKGKFGRILNLDFYIDDHEDHLESMYRYKKRWSKGLALMTRPWNADSYDASKFVRINNWTELIRHLGVHKR